MLFAQSEFDERLTRARHLMAEHGFDHLVVLEPENVSYLTGFFTEGFNTSFQFAVVPAEGEPLVVSRTAEKFWLDRTCPWASSALLWNDGETPVEVTVRALREFGVRGRVGIEMGSWRANTRYLQAVQAALPELEFVDTGDDVAALRFVKSEAELALLRRAGGVAEALMAAAVAHSRPGMTERELAAEVAAAGMRAGNDMAHPGPISSGEAALAIHANYTDRRIETDDLVFAEVTGQVHNYHSRFMRSIVVGEPRPGFRELAQRLTTVQDEALAEVRAGVHCSVPDLVYRKGILGTGVVEHYPNKTFYGVGMLLLPNTLEPLEVNAASDFVFEEGMVFHSYLCVAGFNHSETIAITASGFERLTHFDRELITV